MEHKKHSRQFRNILSYPFIWVLIIPLILSDMFLELYHRICFPLYGLPTIERRKYIRIDRHKLKYLSLTDKLSCMYCGYANGWLHYASVITGETERYWCSIKHMKNDSFIEPKHHKDFLEYGDENSFKESTTKVIK
ncbi:hypothetical protein ACFL0L_04720 [Patescibacteria group bacterium]